MQKTKKTIDEQIKYLNESVKLKLCKSGIHGVGVQAIRDIEQGEKLYAQETDRFWYTVPYKRFSELQPEIEQIIIERWPTVYDGGMFMHPHEEVRLQSFMNHGNPSYDPKTDTITRKVGKGTEILENYMDYPNANKVYPFLM